MSARGRARTTGRAPGRAAALVALTWILALPPAAGQSADAPPASPAARPETAEPPGAAATRLRGMPVARPEDRLLPAECLYTNGTQHTLARPDLYAGLLKRYGEGWSHMHHYCNALRMNLEYHRSTTPPMRRRTLGQRMIGELDYVIRHSPPYFDLLPLVITRKIEYLDRMGRTSEAFETAMELSERFPDLSEGHARLAVMLRRAGRAAEAEAVIARARGLVANPAELDATVQRLAALQ